MTVDPQLVEILVCPETRRPVRVASAEELARVNAGVRTGTLRNRGGAKVEKELSEALIREDGRVVFPIDDGIPSMLVEESIPVS
jgi:uncharacterized protein YbaR (Trm112 family)